MSWTYWTILVRFTEIKHEEVQVRALVVNALGRGFDVQDVDIAAPIGREVLVEVQASGLCHGIFK